MYPRRTVVAVWTTVTAVATHQTCTHGVPVEVPGTRDAEPDRLARRALVAVLRRQSW